MTVAVDVAETTVAELMKSIERGDKVQLRENGQAVAVMSPTSSAEGVPRRTEQQVAAAAAALVCADERSRRLGLSFDMDSCTPAPALRL